MNSLKDMWKIPFLKNSKIPAIKKWTEPEQHKKQISDIYDTAIITGRRNNLIVFDVDIKDEGMEEYNKYKELNGEFKTLSMLTKSGGYHFYFKYEHSNEATQYLINEYLVGNRAKLRHKGLDIRSNGGCVKAFPSEGYSIIDNFEILEIPEILILWLMEDIETPNTKKTKKTKNNIITIKEHKQQYKYNITLSEFDEMLKMLDDTYLTEYYKWLTVLTVAKNLYNNGLDTYKIFDKFSKKAKHKYDKANNLLLWNLSNGNIDINYLCKVINNDGIKTKLIERFKPPKNDNFINDKYEKMTINKKYLEYDENIFNKYDTIIIKSTTGTGKTTSTAKYYNNYQKKNPNVKLISLVNLIKLSEQQIKTFKDEKVELLNYQIATPTELIENNIVCCLNSIHKKIDIDDDEFENYVVYIDEITSFIDSFLYNDSLNSHLKSTYLILMKIIKRCKKLIVSDAMLNDNVFNLLEQRKTHNNIIITNEYKKYDSIEAIRYNDENIFLNKLAEQVKDDKYFLFGLDSKSTVKKYYNSLIKLFPDKQDKFLMITADAFFKLENPIEQFKNKFVLYSPSITTGIDFTIDTQQDVFIHIKGNTINPSSSFQQATRTRNINKLHYFSPCVDKQYNYNSVEDVENIYKERIRLNEKLLSISGVIDENDELTIINNTFSKLFCCGEYTQDIEQTNKLLHFEDILKNQGFKLSQIGSKKELDKETKKIMTREQKEIESEFIKKYISDTIAYNLEMNKINTGDIDKIDENIILKNATEQDIYKKMVDRKEFLKISDNELNEYSFLISDEYNYNSYFNFMKAFKTTAAINSQSAYNKNNNMDIKLLNETNNKIKLLRNFEKESNIKPFDINFSDNNNFNINDENYKHIKDIFRITKNKPKNNNELKKIYVGMLKNIFGSLNIIKSDRLQIKNKREYVYSFDNELINKLFNVAFKGNNNSFDDALLKSVDISKPIKEKTNIEEKINTEFDF